MSAELLMRIMDQYDSCGFRRWRSANGGYCSSTWIIEREDCKVYVLKQYPVWLPQSGIQHEHSILRHLFTHAFPAPRLVETKTGATSLELNGRSFALFEYLVGDIYSYPIWRLVRRCFVAKIGECLARYHQLMEDFEPQGKEVDGHGFMGNFAYRPCLEDLARYRQIARSGQSLEGFNRTFLEHVEDVERHLIRIGTLLEATMSGCSKTIIHGDVKLSHFVFRRRGPAGMLDFGMARTGVRLIDIAQALMSCARGRRAVPDVNVARQLVQSYQGRYRFSKDEAALLLPWLMFVRIKRLLWDLHQYYDQGRTHLAYLLGHHIECLHWMKEHGVRLSRFLTETSHG